MYVEKAKISNVENFKSKYLICAIDKVRPIASKSKSMVSVLTSKIYPKKPDKPVKKYTASDTFEYMLLKEVFSVQFAEKEKLESVFQCETWLFKTQFGTYQTDTVSYLKMPGAKLAFGKVRRCRFRTAASIGEGLKPLQRLISDL